LALRTAFVTTGLDPVVHADLPASWIAGSKSGNDGKNLSVSAHRVIISFFLTSSHHFS
jgi:hypothetical protein